MNEQIAGSKDSDDEIICFCLGKTKADIVSFMASEDSSFESLMERTGVGTKCAACRLNLEVLVGEEYVARTRKAKVTSNAILKTPAYQYNCGYYLVGNGFNTTLRISNPAFPFAKQEIPVATQTAQLKTYSGEGKLISNSEFRLDANEDHSVDFSKIQSIAAYGWFTLDIKPESGGFIGNTRPQVVIAHQDHCSSYHMQLVKDASLKRTVTVPCLKAKTGMFFCLINMHNTQTELNIDLDGLHGEYHNSYVGTIGPHSAVLVELDDIFEGLPERNLLVANVEATVPIRRYFFVKHEDGSLSMDHFPNTR